MTRVLVTGASGFVGRTLCSALARSGYVVRAALRADRAMDACISEKCVVGAIGSSTDWTAALSGVDTVIHLAARAHVLGDKRENTELYFETNARGTQRLATAAAGAGIRRFINLSSIKVNGEQTTDRAYRESDLPHPVDAYGQSKWLAEKFVADIATKTGMEALNVRSPLVYGPAVRANFLRLLRWVDAEHPLPFGAINNSRSLVSVWNLADLLTNLVRNPVAPGRTWMASDGQDLSTPELIRRIATAMGRRPRLLSVPAGFLRVCGALVGRRDEVTRLCGSLTVDITPTRNELHWSPCLQVDEALALTVNWYLSEGRSIGG